MILFQIGMICGLCSVLNFWDQRQCRCMGTCMLHRRVYLLICQPYIFELIRCRKLTWWPAWHMHMHGDFTSTSKLLFASFSERVLVQNVSHENDLIFNEAVTYFHRKLFFLNICLGAGSRQNCPYTKFPLGITPLKEIC